MFSTNEEDDNHSRMMLTENERSYILETPDAQCLTPFLISLTLSDLKIAKLLKGYGCNINAKTNLDNNALHVISAAGNGTAIAYINELGLAQEYFRQTNKKKIKPFEVASKWENSSVKAEIYKLFVDRSNQFDNCITTRTNRERETEGSNHIAGDKTANIVLEQRPLTKFARSYSKKKLKEINEEGNKERALQLQEKQRKKKLKEKMLQLIPNGSKKFRFNVK